MISQNFQQFTYKFNLRCNVLKYSSTVLNKSIHGTTFEKIPKWFYTKDWTILSSKKNTTTNAMITDVVSPTVTIHNNNDTKDDSNKQSTKPNVVSDSTITPNETSKKTGLTASSTVTTLDDMETKVILTNLKNASNVNYVETQNWKKGLKGIRRKKYTWTFLTVCGFVGGVIIYTHDLIVKYMFQGRLTLINAFDSNSYFGLRLVLWILFNLVFMYVSLMMTIFIAPASEGSGIPAIKGKCFQLKLFLFECVTSFD